MAWKASSLEMELIIDGFNDVVEVRFWGHTLNLGGQKWSKHYSLACRACSPICHLTTGSPSDIQQQLETDTDVVQQPHAKDRS